MKKLLILLIVIFHISCTASAMLYKKKDADSAITVYDGKGKEVGYIRYGHCYISGLFVDSSERKKGIGSELFHRAIWEMRDCDKVSWQSYEPAIGFYLKQGAQIEESSCVADPYRMSITPPRSPMSITPHQSRMHRQQKKDNERF